MSTTSTTVEPEVKPDGGLGKKTILTLELPFLELLHIMNIMQKL